MEYLCRNEYLNDESYQYERENVINNIEIDEKMKHMGFNYRDYVKIKF